MSRGLDISLTEQIFPLEYQDGYNLFWTEFFFIKLFKEL